jgi:hypothetical protein
VKPIDARDLVFLAGSFSPDSRRFAAVVGDRIYVDDLRSRRRTVLAFRVSLERTPYWGTSLRWIDPTSFVVFGGAANTYGGDLWRLRVDGSGAEAPPPQILLRNDRDASLLIHDAQPGKLTFERGGVTNRTLLIDGESATALPGSLAPMFASSADRAGRRVLVGMYDSARRWAWLSLDGTSIEPVRFLDGFSMSQLGPGAMMAVDLRTDPVTFVAFDDTGTELIRTPLPAPRGVQPVLRCSRSRCVMMWHEDHIAVTAAIDGLALQRPVRHDPATLNGARLHFGVSPDGTQIAAVTVPFTASLVLLDLDTLASHRITSETCGRIENVRYSPDGSLLLACLRRHAGALEYALVRRDVHGRERVIWHGDASINGFAILDDHRLVLNLAAYQHELMLLEDAR